MPAEPTEAPDSRPGSAADLVAARLFEARSIVITGEIDQKVAAHVTAQLLALAAASNDDITVYINSQGGHVESGDTIHDMIRFVTPRVRMVGTGWVASAGALIFVAVPPTPPEGWCIRKRVFGRQKRSSFGTDT